MDDFGNVSKESIEEYVIAQIATEEGKRALFKNLLGMLDSLPLPLVDKNELDELEDE
tara:strand:- start:540 stop:710 length:171 start_codon:yes stop_codon:yes gene_type:complete